MRDKNLQRSKEAEHTKASKELNVLNGKNGKDAA
jgi:hypothetical protein